MWLITKKRLVKYLKKVYDRIKTNKETIDNNSKEILDLKLQLAELKGELKNKLIVREQVREAPRTKTKYHKKAQKIADKVQILAEIKKLLNKNLSTTELYEVIVNQKQLCRKTCFYKYLKLVREQTIRTPRTKLHEL